MYLLNNYFKTILKIFGLKRYFLSFVARPKCSNNSYLKTFNKTNRRLGILIQGPTANNFKFVIESIKIYKKIFPKSIIVLSTWNDLSRMNIEIIKKLNVSVVINNYKKKFGYPPTDYQIETTYNGLIELKKKKVQDVIKLRTDTRIYKNNIYDYLINLQKNFSIKKKNIKFLKQRIVVSSLLTHKFRLFGLSDLFLFGQINDLIKYFDKKYYLDFLKEMKIKKLPLIIKSTLIDGETFFCYRFLKENKFNFKFNIDGWISALKDLFIIIDHDQIDLFWKKYDWINERKTLNIKNLKTSPYISFNDWLNIYNNNFDIIKKYKYRERWKYYKNKVIKI